MTDKYSKEDLEAFERKDKLNSRMSALKAVSVIFEGTGAPTSQVTTHATEYYNWLVQDQTFKAEIPNPTTEKALNASEQGETYPVPTVNQLKWLKSIEDNYKFTAEQVYQAYGKYPNNKDQAIEAVKILKGK